MQTRLDSINHCLNYYKVKLAQETNKFRVKMVTNAAQRHNSHVLSDSQLWVEMTKKLDDNYYAINDGQIVGLIVCGEYMSSPKAHYDLWSIVRIVQWNLENRREQDAFEDLLYYDGPYRIDVPSFTEEILS